VANAIANNKPGDEVHVVYYRGNQKKSANIKLGKRPNQLNTGLSGQGPQPPGGGGGDLFPFP
jgi:hypothetical protein